MLVQYKYGENHSLDDIIKKIKEQFELKLSKKGMQQMLDSYMTLQEILIIRLVPSFLKDIIMGYSAKIGKRGQTVALSNLGIVKIQEEYEEYIDSFAALASTEDMQLTVTSFKDKIVLGFTSHIINKEIERTMIELLKTDAGVSAKIYSNMGDAYEM
jgi:hypothetical protein